MNIDFAFICDYAQAGPKMNALGIGFDTIYAAKVPVKHNHFSLVMQLRASVVEIGTKKMVIHIIDDDGKDVVPPLNANFPLQVKEHSTEAVGRIVLEFGNVEFQHFGSYSVRAVIEGLEMASINFNVLERPQTPKPGNN